MNIPTKPNTGWPGVQRTGQSPFSGSRTGPRIPLKRLFLATALACASLGLSAEELPQIQDVVSGTATISQDGKSMQIQTQTGRTAIDWKNFSIGPDNKVHFQQPDGTSITLNRVVGGKPSNIFGMLTSNGKLVLLNPAGIWFGPNSRISSSSLIAGAGMITDEQVRKFSETGKLNIQLQGGVRNQGEIRAAEGGSVTLLGAQVENQGVIQALKGQVNLATGPKATLDFHGDGLLALAVDGEPGDAGSVDPTLSGGVHNSGHIDVGSGVVAMSSQRAASHLESVISVGGAVVADSVSAQGGTIVLGNAERSQVSGTLSARGTEGGSIKVLGDQVNLTDGARLDASGSQGRGGSVLVGGNFQGRGSEQRAQSTTVAPGAQLRADGATDGGLVVAWSDGDTQFSGSASARGGERGGLVETSGKRLSVGSEARIDTSGGRQAGTWLLDPEVINVEENAGPGAVAASALVEALKHGNVEVAATERINVNAPIVAQEVFRTVDSQGNPTGATLALIAAGSPTQGRGYIDAAGNTADLHDDSGSVYINAPILLAGGNLFIAATGDVRLVNLTPGQSGDAAMSRRAIVDVGDGIIWIKTSNVATISQDAGTALIGERVALEGASVRMESELNYAGTLAGKASNGVFRFYQTNASGTTSTGTVNSPFSSESLTGVTAQQLRYVGSQEIVADVGYNPASKDVTLAAGGETFDYLVFEATGFVGADGQLLPPEVLLNYLDSSDYLVDGLSFTVDGKVWKFVPDAADPGLTQFYIDGQLQGSLPIGFAISANGGLQVVSTVLGATGWGVQPYAHIPGAHNQAEIQHDSQSGASQQLVISLGERVDQVQTLLGWLIDDGIWGDPPVNPDGPTSSVLRERAVVHYLRTEEAPNDVVLNASKASVNVQADDASRTYGDANPTWQSQRSDNDAMQAIREVDAFVDRQLGQQRSDFQVQHGSVATERSNVGQYAIDGQVTSAGSRVDRRFDVSFGEARLTITPAPLVVTADSHTKQAGDADPALTYQTQGWKFDSDRDASSFAMTRAPGEAPGNYRVFEQDGTRMISANYLVTVIDGNLAINGPVAPEPPPTPEPTPQTPTARPEVGGSLAAGTTAERCTAIESPSSVTAAQTVSPAIVRTYSVQLICKPRAYGNGDAQQQLPDRVDLINYANAWLKDGRFQLPDWNRSVIPRDLPGREGGK